MAEKFHHKLYVMNTYLRKDLDNAHQHANTATGVTNTAVDTLDHQLEDMKKANKMRHLVNSVRNFYQQSSKEYSLKVAIFVSRHKVLDNGDYAKLQDALTSKN